MSQKCYSGLPRFPGSTIQELRATVTQRYSILQSTQKYIIKSAVYKPALQVGYSHCEAGGKAGNCACSTVRDLDRRAFEVPIKFELRVTHWVERSGANELGD